MSSQWHLHIISRPSTISENSSQLKVYLPLWCPTMALHSMEMNSKGLLKSSTSCTPHHHLISTSPMVSLRPWWRRSRTPTRKLMDLQMLKQEHYFSYETPLSQQIFLLLLKFFMDDQHKEQSFQDPQNWSTYVRFGRDSLKYRTHRRNSLTEHYRAKDLWVLKVNEQVQFFPNKQGTGPLTWLTGTVTEILDCGCSYMIQGPNGRVYRRNRAHLKPICYDGTSFQDHPVKKEEKQPEINSFQDPKPTKVKTMSFPLCYINAMSKYSPINYTPCCQYSL